jgi:hypothetical protein
MQNWNVLTSFRETTQHQMSLKSTQQLLSKCQKYSVYTWHLSTALMYVHDAIGRTLLIMQTTAGWYGYCRKMKILWLCTVNTYHYTYSFPKFTEFYENITWGSEDICLFKNLFLQRNAHLDMPNMYSDPSEMQNLNGIKGDDGKISPTPYHTALRYI